MLDKLALHIPFKKAYIFYSQANSDKDYGEVPLESLPNIRLVAGDVRLSKAREIADITELKCPFESLPSHYSGLAFKVYHRGMNCDPFVMIKCSPAKLLQGHNAYGPQDMGQAAANMFHVLYSAYSKLYDMLDFENVQVSEFDVTYSTMIKGEKLQKLFIDHMSYLSGGRMKSGNNNYATTVYFGDKCKGVGHKKRPSRNRRCKIYLKLLEMVTRLEEMKRHKEPEYLIEIYENLIETDFVKDAARFEATIKKRFLIERAIPTELKQLVRYIKETQDFYEKIFNEAWRDIFKSFEGQEITMMTDEKVREKLRTMYFSVNKNGHTSYRKADRLFNFYQTLKHQGYYSVKAEGNERTFRRNVRELVEVGISKGVLQNLHKDSGAQIIPIPRIIQIDFSNQHPNNYQPPKNLFDLGSVVGI